MQLLKDIKRTYTTVDLSQDCGLIARYDAHDQAYIAAVRWWNFAEALVVFALVMAVVWCEYWLDARGTQLFRIAVALPTLCWMFILSPLVHYRFEKNIFVLPTQAPHGLSLYFWEFRGLGNPWRYYVGRKGEAPLALTHKKVVLALLLTMTLLYTCAAITFWSEIDARYGHYYGDSLSSKLVFIATLLIGLNLLWLFLGFPFMLRLDNFTRNMRFMATFLISALVFILLFNVMFQLFLEPFRETLESWHHFRLRGAPARERLAILADPLAIGGQWSGYVTWGWVQQLIFASYFGVLFSRAYPVEKSRWELTKACLGTATVFSLVHMPNFWLMVFTFVGGFFGTIIFLQSHNLFLLGFSHGFGGSLLNKLTPINFSVGAGQMPK